ncbi:MAG: hypothetical protein IJY83_00525 [Oscillospiraceae bacterium]|nr:hypothetical protein [Oscillospiraceae bacterium]MBR5822874.1 hypothetical protein [Paludibacteraceae bacterium]
MKKTINGMRCGVVYTKTANGRAGVYITSLCRLFILFLLLILGTSVCAQSEGTVQIELENNEGDDFISTDELPKRDLDIAAILPLVLYDNTSTTLSITSQNVTFESVNYYIVDETNLVSQQGEIILPKGVEITISLLQVLSGVYRIVLDFEGNFFQGYFYVE